MAVNQELLSALKSPPKFLAMWSSRESSANMAGHFFKTSKGESFSG